LTNEPFGLPPASYGDVLTFAAGTVVVAEGETGDEMFVIARGSVAVETQKDGQRQRIAELGPGEIFGELAVVDRETRSATVIALDDGVDVIPVNQARFVFLVSQQPAFALFVIRKLGERLRRAR
jgi:CRP/FNR family transcriptional regulator, cyclic AMP receptor protein